MKRYTVLFALLLGLAAFMFAQANPQAPPQSPMPGAAPATTAPAPGTPAREPDDDHNLNAAPQDRDQQSSAAQSPDYSQQAPDRDRDQQNNSGQDVNRDRDNNQDRDRSQVYDRDQPYQDQDRRDQQDRDRDSNADQDRNRDRDNNVNRDRDNDMDRNHDRNRVGTGGDVQSQIYSALHNDRNLSDVNVQVRGNRIDLTGNVPTGKDRNEALRIAQSYGNGMRIDDHIKVSGRGHDRDDHQ